MYFENKTTPEFYKQAKGKVFVCKKDIKCKNGTFTKGTLVYTDFDFDNELSLFDLSQPQDDYPGVYGCKNDHIAECLTADNFNEYFLEQKEALIYLREVEEENETLYSKSNVFCVLSEISLIGTATAAAFSMLNAIGYNTSGPSLLFWLLCSGAFMLFMLLFGFIKRYKDNKADKLFENRMKYLKSVALGNEYNETAEKS